MTHEPRPIRAKTLPLRISLGLTALVSPSLVTASQLSQVSASGPRFPRMCEPLRESTGGGGIRRRHIPLLDCCRLSQDVEPFFVPVLVRPSDHHGSRSNDTSTPQRRHGTVRAIRAIRPIPRAGGHNEREEIAL